MSSRLKDIPRLARDGKNLNAVVDGVLEALQTFRGYRGDLLDKALTPRDFAPGVLGGLTGGGITAGGITIIGGGVGVGGAPYEPDYTPPPTATFPAGRLITAGMMSIFIECDTPTYTQGHGHDRTVVYGAKWPASDPTAPTFSEAVELFSFQGTFGAYPSDSATRWCVWIKWKSNDGVLSVDPAGGTNGQQATTGQDVSLLLESLTNAITSSQLDISLRTPIGLVTAADTVPGSVAARVKAETDARVAAITLARSDFADADADTLASATSYVTTYAYSKSTVDSAFSALDLTLRADFAAADSTTLASANAFTYSRATIDGAISSSATTLTAAYGAADTLVLAAADAAAASRDSTVLASANDYTYSRATIDGAIASSASTLTANYGSAISSAVSTEASARAALDGAVQALYTVRAQVSSGGTTMVGGFGLAATATSGGGATIDFGVIANRFYVGAPNDGSAPGIPDAVPFIIQASPTTLNGVPVPAGMYVRDAFILNGSITNVKIGNAAIDDAKVANLSAAKLTVGDGTVGGNLKSNSYTGGSGGTPGVGWLLTPGGTVFMNSAVVYGTVYASAGIFAGALSAATGTFAGALSAATGTFAGDISAASGTFAGSLNINSGGSDRMEITNTRIKVFSGGVERVRIGDLS